MAAAVAARAKLERLLAAPAPFADDDGSISPEVRKALEAVDLPRHQYLDELWAALVGGRLIVPVAAHAHPCRMVRRAMVRRRSRLMRCTLLTPVRMRRPWRWTCPTGTSPCRYSPAPRP